MPGQQPARGLAVGAAAPWLAELTERGLQRRPSAGWPRASAVRRATGGAVQPGQDADEGEPVAPGSPSPKSPDAPST